MDGGQPETGRLDLRSMLKLHEGWRAFPYRDTVGKLTIGHGRNLDAKGISPLEGDFLLSNDIDEAQSGLAARFPWTDRLDEVRHAVLVDMGLNLGIGGLAGFKTTLRLVEDGNYQEASVQMLKSLWSQQVGIRAERLSWMMASGEWPSA